MSTENDNGGWTSIDPKEAAAAKEPEVSYDLEDEVENTEKVETKTNVDNESNYEIVSENDEQDNSENVQEVSEKEQISELEGINSKGAEKRIRQLVQQRKEREAQLEAMSSELNKLRSELIKTQQTTKSYEISSLYSRENELNERIRMAESNYLRAYDDGEKEKLLEAQNVLNDAKTDLKIIQARKAQLEAAQEQEESKYTKELEQYQTYQEEQRPAQHQQQQQQTQPQAQRKLDPFASEWFENNSSWFGQDEVATTVALALDQKLKNEGYDPQTKEFYNEIDRLLKAELPNKFNRGTDAKKPSQVVAGTSRKSSPKGNKVKLTQKDVDLAKKWGIPLDRYAAEKHKVDNLNGNYTTIETKRA